MLSADSFETHSDSPRFSPQASSESGSAQAFDLRQFAELRAKEKEKQTNATTRRFPPSQRNPEHNRGSGAEQQSTSLSIDTSSRENTPNRRNKKRSSILMIDASDEKRNSTPDDAKLSEIDYQLNGSRARCDSGEFIPPRWVLDQEVIGCTLCRSLFDVFNRRHHCRHCGLIFCEPCSAFRALLPYEFRIGDPQRVCKVCNDKLTPLQPQLTMSIANHQKQNSIDMTSCYNRYANMPVSFALDAEIRKAAYSVYNLFNMEWVPDRSIPLKLLQNVRGIAFLTVVKGGFGVAFKVGTGLVVSRLPDGRWSAPSAIGTFGVSWGALIGADVTDYVIFLNTIDAVKAFAGTGSISIGAGIEVALGPVGRAGSADMNIGTLASAPAYSYSHSRGLYAGVSLDGSVVVTRNDMNMRFYGRPVEPLEILGGQVTPPRAAQPLYEALNTALNALYDPHYPHQAPVRSSSSR